MPQVSRGFCAHTRAFCLSSVVWRSCYHACALGQWWCSWGTLLSVDHVMCVGVLAITPAPWSLGVLVFYMRRCFYSLCLVYGFGFGKDVFVDYTRAGALVNHMHGVLKLIKFGIIDI